MENLIKNLNTIYLLVKSPNEMKNIWNDFEKAVLECKNKGLIFKYIRFENDIYLSDRTEIDEETLSRIEACNVSISNIEQERDDPYNLGIDGYKQFLENLLLAENRERDFLFADALASAEFHLMDDVTIGYSSCINPIVDYKLKYYIGKHYGF